MSNIFTKKGYSNTYGELNRDGLTQLFKNISVKDKVFYDLGSGKGQVVINAVKMYPSLKKIVGIELDTDRHNEAVDLLKRSEIENLGDKCILLNDDILDSKVHYSDADIIYISNLCFSEKVNKKLAKKLCNELRVGSMVFASRPIKHRLLELCDKLTVEQSWFDSSNINVYKVKPNKRATRRQPLKRKSKTRKE